MREGKMGHREREGVGGRLILSIHVKVIII
jgi:hypothetical protein